MRIVDVEVLRRPGEPALKFDRDLGPEMEGLVIVPKEYVSWLTRRLMRRRARKAMREGAEELRG